MPDVLLKMVKDIKLNISPKITLKAVLAKTNNLFFLCNIP